MDRIMTAIAPVLVSEGNPHGMGRAVARRLEIDHQSHAYLKSVKQRSEIDDKATNRRVILKPPPPLMIPDVFWHRCSSVCCRIGQRHRVQQVDITRIGREENATSLRCPERPAHQVSPPLSTRRLAGVRYQLDSRYVQAGVVDNGRHQEDPVVRWPCKHAYTDDICRNVLTPLASRFETHGAQGSAAAAAAAQQLRWECSQSRASERPREASWV